MESRPEKRYLTSKKEFQKKFNFIELKWEDNDLIVNFLNQGFASELFIVLKCFSREDLSPDYIFSIKKEKKGNILKESLNVKKINNLSYEDFISSININSSKNTVGSEKWEDLNLVGYEFRYHKTALRKEINGLLPSVFGAELLLNLIFNDRSFRYWNI